MLSAILFLIFINDLLETNFCGSISAFADDIYLFYSQKDVRVLFEDLSSDLKLLKLWCNENGMQVNVLKTKYINFGFKTFDLPQQLKYHTVDCGFNVCNCQCIEKVSSFKYLGVTIDSKLTWENHITELHGKLRNSIRTFYYLRNFCGADLMRTLYFALIQSRLQYAISCWGQHSQNINKCIKGYAKTFY